MVNTTLTLALMIAALAAITITAHHDTIRTIERHAMAINATIQDSINAVVAQLHKAHLELSERLENATTSIQAQLAEAGVAEQIDLSELEAIAQKLDDLTPDALAGNEVELVTEDGGVLATASVSGDVASETAEAEAVEDATAGAEVDEEDHEPVDEDLEAETR